MKTISGADLARQNWGGLKPLAGALLKAPLVNPVLRWAMRGSAPAVQARLPLALPSVGYRLKSGAAVHLLRPDRDQIARDIYWGGGRPVSAADTRALRLVELLCARPSTFVDIGSYAALFALVAAAAHAETRAIAFEIVPENFQAMIANILANDAATQVEARLVGLGRSDDTLRMPVRMGSASSASSLSLGSAFDDGIEIPVRTLDAELPAIGERPLVMKLDVEGFEADVLAGAGKTLATHRPTMVCEVLPGSTRHGEIEALLAPLGYRFAQITDDGFAPAERIVPRRGLRDYVLYADPEVEQVLARVVL